MKKRFFLAAMTLLVSMGAFAQGNGIGGITEATNMVTSEIPAIPLPWAKAPIETSSVMAAKKNLFFMCRNF